MKKIVLIIIALFAITVYGQTEKGNIFIGVQSNFNFSSSKYITTSNSQNYSNSYTSETTNSFTFTPQIGYIASDNVLLGLDFKFSTSKVKNQDSNGFYTISPFAKYYFLDSNFKPFLKASLGLGSFFNSYQNYSVNSNVVVYEKVNTKINTAKVGGGLAYFFNNLIALEFNLDYFQDVYKSDNNQNDYNTKQTHSGIQSTIGFAIFL
ncbi:MAG: hypothetical protein ABJH82_03145 [Polaribacter sp.]|uniref:hypothetical protein n=1 Tax=Polaribacter sp. TaxID=1920175 RepID=UPI00326525DD